MQITVWTKMIAVILSLFSWFQIIGRGEGQPNNIPETRYASYTLAPDQYGIWPTDEFETATPESQHIDAERLDKQLEKANKKSGKTATDSLLVYRSGKLVYEKYFNGFDENTPHYLASVTKSILSTLVGIAIHEGKIKGTDQTVADFFSDAVFDDARKKDITIEHLLTMTSGIGDTELEDDDPAAWWNAADSGKAAFEQTPLDNPPGKKFYYSGAAPHILACALRRAVGVDLMDYANEKLFGPLGITSAAWEAAADGNYFGGGGISMTPRDMVRMGYLYLNEGRWEDKQIIPVDWALQVAPKATVPYAYGRMFWNSRCQPLSGWYEMNGANGQIIEICPSKDMVIVRTGNDVCDYNYLLGGIKHWAK